VNRDLVLIVSATTLAVSLSVGLSACFPKHSDGSFGHSDSAKTPSSNLFSVTHIQTGSPAVSPNTDPQGWYYSRDPHYTVSGVCRSVQKVRIKITPAIQSPTQETVNCTNDAFTWTQAFTGEDTYAIQFIALDSSGTPIGSIAPIHKTLVYDITPPSAPIFSSPTTSTQYTINDGRTQITITGQVGDADLVRGPSGQTVALTENPDHVHQDFSTSVAVPHGSTLLETFTASDYAGNTASTTLSLDSTVALSVPIAANELGGSAVFNGVFVQSSIGWNSAAVVNDHVQWTSGSAGMIGDLQ